MTRNILITGASYGIGAEIAKEYCQNGDNVFLLARTEDKLKNIKNECDNFAGSCNIYVCDISKINEVEIAINNAIEILGTIDIAILNAGIGGPQWFKNFDRKVVDEVFDVNFFGVVNAMQFLIPLMKMQKYGKIVGISSLAETRGFPGSGAYCASKAALSIFLESARLELKNLGIEVMTIKPGFVKSFMTSKNDFYMPFLMDTNKAAKKIIRSIEQNKTQYNFPKRTALLVFLLRLVPNFIFDRLAKIRKVPLTNSSH